MADAVHAEPEFRFCKQFPDDTVIDWKQMKTRSCGSETEMELRQGMELQHGLAREMFRRTE
jgi:hypothetical protein